MLRQQRNAVGIQLAEVELVSRDIGNLLVQPKPQAFNGEKRR